MRAAAITLAAVSLVYAGISAYTDLKARELYVFPAWALSIAWIILLLAGDIGRIAFKGGSPLISLMIYVGVNIVLMLVLSRFKVWGGGDTDFMMMYAMYLYGMWGSGTNIFSAFILEISGITMSVIAAVLTAVIECGIRKQKIGFHYGAAVIPGFFIGMVIPLVIMPFV